MGEMIKVYCCYNHESKDKEIKEIIHTIKTELEGALSGNLFKCFVQDKRDKEHLGEIKQEIRNSDVMLVFITEDFYDSEYVGSEIGIAYGNDIFIIPIKLGLQDLKGCIKDMEAIDARYLSPTKELHVAILFKILNSPDLACNGEDIKIVEDDGRFQMLKRTKFETNVFNYKTALFKESIAKNNIINKEEMHAIAKRINNNIDGQILDETIKQADTDS